MEKRDLINLDRLPKDVLFTLVKDMSYGNIINLCRVSKVLNEKICSNESIWLYKLKNEYPELSEFEKNKDFNELAPRYKYKLLNNLTILNEKLDLDFNLFELFNLERLWFNRKGIEEIPNEIGNLVNLQILYSHTNQIQNIPPAIGNLRNLTELDLNHNQIKVISEKIGNLVNLKTLSLSYNKIKSLPSEIGNLTNLEELDLYKNQIKKLPREIGNLNKLRILSLGNNKIEELPREIGNLVNLQGLYLFGNRIKEIPIELSNLNTHVIDLRGNPIQKIPKKMTIDIMKKIHLVLN